MTASALAPLPAAFPLPAGYPRHAPSVQQTAAAMDFLAARQDWAALGWPELLRQLVRLGRTDIPLARLVEGHVDATRILLQAGRTPRPGRYAVWASRSQATGIAAAASADGWQLDGTLRFASGAGVVDRALVPVWTGPREHLLLDLDVSRWVADESDWQTRAMAPSRSHTVHLRGLAARRDSQVGGPSFYLDRPLFFPGGVGVAAVWVGAMARVADLTLDYGAGAPASVSRSIRLGGLVLEVATGHALVGAAGARLTEVTDPGQLRAVATECRAGVGAAGRRLLDQARSLAGAAGLAFAADLTRAVDDLELYLRQQSPDADAEQLARGQRDAG